MSNWLITANGPMPVKTDGLDVTEQARRLLIEAGWVPPTFTLDEIAEWRREELIIDEAGLSA